MELVSDVKKKVTEISKRLNKDMDGFNHLDTIHRHLDDVLQVIQYMEDKISLREAKSLPEIKEKVSKKKSVKTEKVDFDS